MTVTLEARTPCWLCGYQHRIVQVSSIRVNKNSIRTLGNRLICLGTHVCPECGELNRGEPAAIRFRMDPDDLAKVRAYQLRRWPCPS